MRHQVRSYQTRDPLAVHNPLRSVPFSQPAYQVMGWSPLQKAEFALITARQNLAGLAGGVEHACKALGRANRMRTGMRRYWQGQAFRAINTARARQRRALKALAAAEAAMLALAPATLAA